MESKWYFIKEVNYSHIRIYTGVDRLVFHRAIPPKGGIIEFKIISLPHQSTPPVKDLELPDAGSCMITICGQLVIDPIAIGRYNIGDIDWFVCVYDDQDRV